jgi:hypothetical protein
MFSVRKSRPQAWSELLRGLRFLCVTLPGMGALKSESVYHLRGVAYWSEIDNGISNHGMLSEEIKIFNTAPQENKTLKILESLAVWSWKYHCAGSAHITLSINEKKVLT